MKWSQKEAARTVILGSFGLKIHKRRRRQQQRRLNRAEVHLGPMTASGRAGRARLGCPSPTWRARVASSGPKWPEISKQIRRCCCRRRLGRRRRRRLAASDGPSGGHSTLECHLFFFSTIIRRAFDASKHIQQVTSPTCLLSIQLARVFVCGRKNKTNTKRGRRGDTRKQIKHTIDLAALNETTTVSGWKHSR